MPAMGRTTRMVIVAVVVLVALVVAVGSILDWWDWKALIGWKALVGYIRPEDATGRKDAVQVYVVIVAGSVAAVTAAVGLVNLYYTRKNLNQQREIEKSRAEDAAALEAQRAQGSALQAYYEQMGKLLTEHDLRNTERKDIKLLARGQTLSVLRAHFKTATPGACADRNTPKIGEYLLRSARPCSRPSCLQQGFEMHS